MLRRTLVLAASFLAGAALPALAGPGPITIGGSDLLQSAVGEPLQRYIRQNSVDAQVNLVGSQPALVDLKTGRLQIAFIAAPAGPPPSAPAGYEPPVVFCFQVAYIIVNDDNPINEIERAQLVGVFGASSEADVNRWDKLGVTGSLGSKSIEPVTTSADDGITLELFKNTVLGRTSLKSRVRILSTPGELLRTITENSAAIGVSSSAPPDGAKTLLVSVPRPGASTATSGTGATQAAYPPTPENVYNGDYPIRLPFYLLYKTEDKARVREILRQLYSEAMTESLRANHLMPLPDTVRQRRLLELDSAQ